MSPTNPRWVIVLGSTGSIGRQAVVLIAANPDLFAAVALVAGRNEGALAEQAARLGVTPTDVPHWQLMRCRNDGGCRGTSEALARSAL